MNIPQDIRDALEATGLPWTAERSSRGPAKIKLCGRMAGMCTPATRGRAGKSNRAAKNVIAQIRRLAAELKEERS